MTGYSRELAALAPLGKLDLVERFVAAHPRAEPEVVAVMSRDALIAALLPPVQRGRRVTRPYPREAQ